MMWCNTRPPSLALRPIQYVYYDDINQNRCETHKLFIENIYIRSRRIMGHLNVTTISKCRRSMK